ncbi:tRNA lysidine(34) synthetase TilS [Anianabacter salinae]|uniref:tRNA lysidine(34) synthetase TilS n=1 Tax=Anianabacter salinae TaxID=2851023 RepID=UPI00225DEC9B|nr:tRNA lysidine(34) synthetase TilS [Anianabacter salinae]MBV0911268.1 tRNA lysidine(34) synthetase TilS [Anianabacter salinae]
MPKPVIEARVHARLATLLPARPPVCVAVSGGGDSMALLHIVAAWTNNLRAVTVDHGLREASAAEARQVAETCAALGVPHETLRWTGWTGSGNLQDAARRARIALIDRLAAERGTWHVLTGHTADDHAETVMLRLARGSGVDGLSGISASTRHGPQGALWLRPLLAERREDLRDYLRGKGAAWSEDPSNDDPRFDRVRARRLLAGLGVLGLTHDRLIETARHMSAAREVLEGAMHSLAAQAVQVDRGDLVLDPELFAQAPDETRHRLLAAALQWVSGAVYRPRFGPLRALAQSMDGTLHGCRVYRNGGAVRITRELSAVAECIVAPPGLWDGRWHLAGPDSDVRIAPLGEAGLSLMPKDQPRTLPAISAIASPAVWRGETLVAAPVAGFSGDWRASLAKGRDIFPAVDASR